MEIVHVTKDNYQQEVLNASGTVLLDFWATWCGPCRMIAPILEEIAGERDDVKICKIDVDTQGDLAMQFQIVSIPTLIVMKDGQVTGKSVGAKPKTQILEML